ncbi:sperm acrosome membrane-associated protein 4-like [Anabas testudineus]|uniref:sperm acrosome membrane-associated protein 4-like n=1 Tax=Anabas testudineus TaxID=64144 RepID=UPI000E45805D|nr:sperm acrosome membrane-associated protein 4-like [Anabas testudineus]
MGKVLFGVIVAVASLMLVDSLTCNNCPFSLAGLCFSSSQTACSSNTSVCGSSKAVFPSLSSFGGFTTASCLDSNTTCGSNTQATLLGVTYNTTVTCCTTDKCNTVNAAPSTKMTLGATLGVAAVALVWGSML